MEHHLPFVVLKAHTQALPSPGAAPWGPVQAPASQRGSSPPLGNPFPVHRPWMQKAPRGEGASSQSPSSPPSRDTLNQTWLRGTEVDVGIIHHSDTLLYTQTQQSGHN